MTNVKSALLFLAMLSAILISGFGIYSSDAGAHAVVDGYGVVAAKN